MDPRDKLKEYARDQDVLIVGGGPDAKKMPEEYYDGFGVIIRINNYKKVNSELTDVYFSHFGKSIEKSVEDLKSEGCRFVINKYPNMDMTRMFHERGFELKGITDFRWVYELRKKWWFGDFISLSPEELISQVSLLNGVMPTCGFSCVDFFVRTLGIPVEIIGFDGFESGIHNLDEPWDRSGDHNPQRELEVLNKYYGAGLIEWVRA